MNDTLRTAVIILALFIANCGLAVYVGYLEWRSGGDE